MALLVELAVGVWPKRPEMGDRFLVPIASGILIYMLRGRWRGAVRSPSWTGLPAVAAGAIAFAAAWYLLVQVGPRTLLLWWIALALALIAIGLIAADNGWRRATLVAFPIFFTFFALPTPDTLQALLLAKLKGWTTAGAASVLPWLGVPAVRSGMGFTLTLPSGKLGVVDACSGALSLTSLLAIAVLTAYVRLKLRRDFSVPAALALVALTIPIVVLSNMVRVIATGVLQEKVGPAAIQGVWHDVLGYLVILIGFGLIIGVSQVLAAKNVPRHDRAPSEEMTTKQPAYDGWRLSPIVAFVFLLPAAGFCLWAEQLRQAHEQIANLEDIRSDFQSWSATSRTVPPDVAEMLKCDQLVLREYEDHLGHSIAAYFMFWATPASTAHIHHPDVCWPSRGCQVAESRVRPIPFDSHHEPLEVSVRHYDSEEGKREIVFYWTQNGSIILPDGQEPPAGWSEYGWVVDMLRGRRAPERVSRLSVLLAADVPVGRATDQEDRLAALSSLIAADVYRVCPWAMPSH